MAGAAKAQEPGRQRPFVLGLTGDVCAGKSSVAKLLGGWGATVWDADQAVREIYATDDMKAFVRARFGAGLFTAAGDVDRKALGQAVFADPAKLKALTEAIFERTGPRIEAAVEAARTAGAAVLVLDAPTLFESGRAGRCDAVCYVTAPAEWKELRAVRERGWPAGEVALRESRLMDRQGKLAQCRFVMENGTSWEHLEQQVARMWRDLNHGKT